MWPRLLIQNVLLLKHIPKIPLLINKKSAHHLLFISSLGCEAKFSIKTQELTPKGGCKHIWKLCEHETLYESYTYSEQPKTPKPTNIEKNKMLRNQPLLNEKHV